MASRIDEPFSAAGTQGTRELKCLLVTAVFPPIRGGTATVYGNLHKYGGNSLFVLTQNYDLEDGNYIPPESRALERLYLVDRLVAPPTPSTHVLQSVWNFLRSDLPLRVRLLAKVVRLVRDESFDVVCIGEVALLGWLKPLVENLTRAKVLLYVHGEELTMEPAGRFLGRLHHRVLQSATGVVCVSRFTRSVLIDRYHVSPEQICMITNGVDTDSFPSARGAIAAPPPNSKLNLLSLGRLIPRKGFEKLVEAMAIVTRQFRDVHLIIAGDGPLRARLEIMLEQLELQDFVTLAGAVSHARAIELYASCDVFVMPNRTMADGDTEGFGLVFLEANAFGKPVIGGRAGGVVDAIRENVTGLLVDGNDVRDIATAILRLATNPRMRTEIGENGLAWAQKNDVRIKVREFLNYCRTIL